MDILLFYLNKFFVLSLQKLYQNIKYNLIYINNIIVRLHPLQYLYQYRFLLHLLDTQGNIHDDDGDDGMVVEAAEEGGKDMVVVVASPNMADKNVVVILM